jgi:pimeloyl-ACP methyl ester carboxylesterase
MLDRLFDPLVRRMLRPPRRTARALPPELSGIATDVTIDVRGLAMKGWLLRPSTGGGGAVLVVHGWGSDGARSSGLALGLLEAGIAVLLIDLPGHGRTGPVDTYDASLMVDDIASARRWIVEQAGLGDSRIGLLGVSFGGLGAYVAASRDASWSGIALLGVPMGPLEASRLYLEGKGLPGSWLTSVLRRSLTRVLSVDPDEFSGAACLPRVRVPVLIVHGTDDAVVPIAHAQALASAAHGGEREVLWVSGGGHDLSEDRIARERVAAFFRRTLAAA